MSDNGQPEASGSLLPLLLDLHSDLNRFLTCYDQQFRQQDESLIHIQMLAKKGFYFIHAEGENEQGYLQCHFCDFRINPEEYCTYISRNVDSPLNIDIDEKHGRFNCKIKAHDSKDKPLENFDRLKNFNYESHRLHSLICSFQLSLPGAHLFALAKSGFCSQVATGSVQCAFCSFQAPAIQLLGGENVDEEHKLWNPKCPFMSSNQKPVLNFAIGSERTGQQCKKGRMPTGATCFYELNAPEKYGSRLQFVGDSKDKPFVDEPQCLNIIDKITPLQPNYEKVVSRTNSFKKYWPKSFRQTPEDLAQAGFYYVGIGDRVICFYCNLGLKDWCLSDDPFVLHCRWNPSCGYLLMRYGRSYVEQVQNSNQLTTIQQPTPRVGRGNSFCLSCREKNIVCKVNIPCCHMTFCHTCSRPACTTCGSKIVAEISVYY